jgi:protein-S-isoprenylcysteine O-methyltransferase Ste14
MPVRIAEGAVIATSWALWALVWLISGLQTASRGPRTRTRRMSTSAMLGVFVVVIVVRTLVPLRFWQVLVVSQPWVHVVGMVILVASLIFTMWARRVLGLMWSAAPKVKSGHELRTDGPYAITRHPIYTGMLGMFLGTSLAVGLGDATILFPVGLATVPDQDPF